MISIEQAAQRVIDGADEQDKEVFVDPVTIMLVCSILSTVFSAMRMYCQWRQGQKDGQQI